MVEPNKYMNDIEKYPSHRTLKHIYKTSTWP